MRLSLGTAQFGKKYGISNIYGKTSNEEISKIINICKENKVMNIDTAINYKNVEKLIGKYNLLHFKVSTKIPKISSRQNKNINEFINNQINTTLDNLNIKKIYCLFLHYPKELLSKYGDEIFKSIEDLKNKKKICKIGISVYSISELKQLINRYNFDVVQTPLNIIDRRILDSGMYDDLNSKKIEIEIRSIFLQGLLLMNYNQIPKKFKIYKEIFLHWNEFLKKNEIYSIDACISFVKDFKKIKRIVVGCENSIQLIQIINSYKSNFNYKIPNISSKSEKLINPSLW